MKNISNIKELLSDIGLNDEECVRFIASADNKDMQIRLLKKARCEILSSIHEKEKMIQQIDYLIYEININ